MGNKEPDNFNIRYTYITDISFLKKWIAHPDVLKWFPMGSEKEIEEACQCWILFAKYNASLTATINNVPCGIGTLFLMPYKKVAHHALIKLVVDPDKQRQGIGTSLLRNLKHLAKDYFHLDLIHTEVFSGNPLISLLEKQGFSLYGTQENYAKIEGKLSTRFLYEIDLYQNNLKNREFGKEVPEVLGAERETIAGGKARARDEKTEAKPTPPKTDSSGCFGIKGSL